MNNFVTKFAIFTVGAAIGSAVTWYFTKIKYERIAQEEIDSVKEVFSKHKTISEDTIDTKIENPEMTEYKSIVQNYTSENEEEGEPETMDKPYVISPDEFGDSDYEIISLTYYADKVLTDETGDIVDDVEDLVGYDLLNFFGEYEEDSVFVRNDALSTDYEILLDSRNYSDIANIPPHLVD